jgi:hypothetical protein
MTSIQSQVTGIVNEHVENGVLTFPMFAHIARGTRV